MYIHHLYSLMLKKITLGLKEALPEIIGRKLMKLGIRMEHILNSFIHREWKKLFYQALQRIDGVWNPSTINAGWSKGFESIEELLGNTNISVTCQTYS